MAGSCVIAVAPFWHICSGVGHSSWLSLLMIAPLANIIFVYYLAFSEWPFERWGAISSGGTV
jgi:hypothetical protein